MEGWIFDKKVPKADLAEARLPIKVQLYIHELSDLDSANQSFQADFYLVFTWQAPPPSVDKHGEQTAWWPKFEVMNKKELDEASYTSLEYVTSSEVPHYKYTIRQLGVFKLIGMVDQLPDFPFDTQHMVVDMSFWDEEDQIVLIVDPTQAPAINYSNKELFSTLLQEDGKGAISIAQHVNLPEWKIGKEYCSIRTFSHQYRTSMFGRHPRLQWDIPIRRKHKYYFSKILSVALISNLLCGLTFLIPVEMLDARLAIALTIFLALVAFQFVVTDALPKSAKQTHVDRFFVESYSFSSFVVIASITLFILPYENAVLQIIDWVLLGIYLFFNILFTGTLYRRATQHSGTDWQLAPAKDREAVLRFFN
ncbi:MAG: hypothetical protein KTR30_24920 [Saprospiraceae bacterium]|nr:hypothetical protein [Saprospiraceae bacterium]